MARIGIRVATMAALAWAGAVGAQEPVPTGGVVVIDPAVLTPTVLAPEPGIGRAPLELRRFQRPPEGREVVVTVGGVPIRTIEWAEPVELRVRTESGATLTEVVRAAVRAQVVTCRRGEPTATVERTEVNGTFIIEYRCTRLQGFEDQ
jgi:hypothetical protein